MRYPLTLQVNATTYSVAIEAGRTLLSVLRGELGLTGTKEGCDDSECGACMVLVDGRPVNSCSYLALQVDGREVTTVEGLASGTKLHPLQQAFLDHGGVQCGFCTPGMLISAIALLAADPDPTDDEIRAGLSGNLAAARATSGSWQRSARRRASWPPPIESGTAVISGRESESYRLRGKRRRSLYDVHYADPDRETKMAAPAWAFARHHITLRNG